MLHLVRRAKVVIGDLNGESAHAIARDIVSSGGCVFSRNTEVVIEPEPRIRDYRTAIAQKCDVTVWEDQVELFNLAKDTYGAVDVVVGYMILVVSSSHASFPDCECGYWRVWNHASGASRWNTGAAESAHNPSQLDRCPIQYVHLITSSIQVTSLL